MIGRHIPLALRGARTFATRCSMPILKLENRCVKTRVQASPWLPTGLTTRWMHGLEALHTLAGSIPDSQICCTGISSMKATTLLSAPEQRLTGTTRLCCASYQEEPTIPFQGSAATLLMVAHTGNTHSTTARSSPPSLEYAENGTKETASACRHA